MKKIRIWLAGLMVTVATVFAGVSNVEAATLDLSTKCGGLTGTAQSECLKKQKAEISQKVSSNCSKQTNAMAKSACESTTKTTLNNLAEKYNKETTSNTGSFKLKTKCAGLTGTAQSECLKTQQAEIDKIVSEKCDGVQGGTAKTECQKSVTSSLKSSANENNGGTHNVSLNTKCAGLTGTAQSECLKAQQAEINRIVNEECGSLSGNAKTQCESTVKTTLNGQAQTNNGGSSGGNSGGGSGGTGGGGATVPVINSEGDTGTNKSCGDVSTAILDCDSGDAASAIFDILGIALSVLTWGVAIGATVGFVIAGYQYIMAGSNAAQVQKAKMRMIQIVIGLAIYAAFWGIMNWLLPGGLFGNGS